VQENKSLTKMGEEMGTDTSDKTDDTKLNKFCLKHGINPNLIMLKITLFVMYGGEFLFVLLSFYKVLC
jgi:hypothetical protein